MKCAICVSETELAYGPHDKEVCQSCWLESGADDDVIHAADTKDDLKDFADYYADMRRIAKELNRPLKEVENIVAVHAFFHDVTNR